MPNSSILPLSEGCVPNLATPSHISVASCAHCPTLCPAYPNSQSVKIRHAKPLFLWTFFVLGQEQASWVCQCDDNMVQRLETDFKMTLQQQSTLEQWAAWLDNVMMQALKPYEGRPSFPKAARQFLLKWSFYRLVP